MQLVRLAGNQPDPQGRTYVIVSACGRWRGCGAWGDAVARTGFNLGRILELGRSDSIRFFVEAGVPAHVAEAQTRAWGEEPYRGCC